VRGWKNFSAALEKFENWRVARPSRAGSGTRRFSARCILMPGKKRESPIEPQEGNTTLLVLVIAESQRGLDPYPGLDSKSRALMLRMVAMMPAGWQVDTEDIGDEQGKDKKKIG
jgi:hypothetical protein